MPTCTILIGPPGVGKSTWIKNFYPDVDVVSSDDEIEKLCASESLTYSQGFSKFVKEANKLMWDKASACRHDRKDVIIDRTNMDSSARKKFIDFFEGYTFVAIVFELPEKAEWDRRLASRADKFIPAEVIQNMCSRFEFPKDSEGFSEISIAHNVD